MAPTPYSHIWLPFIVFRLRNLFLSLSVLVVVMTSYTRHHFSWPGSLPLPLISRQQSGMLNPGQQCAEGPSGHQFPARSGPRSMLLSTHQVHRTQLTSRITLLWCAPRLVHALRRRYSFVSDLLRGLCSNSLNINILFIWMITMRF